MPHRAHLFSLEVGHALKQSCWVEPYSLRRLRQDLLAGLSVGIIAIPLAMALAIASGVAPQYGLYTAAIAGFVIALTGGSRFSVSGPTAAFVVILYPITQKYGLGGLLMASVMAGVMLVLMALLRLGRLIEYIPEAVTLGFTAGIGVVIATLQVKDFFGLPVTTLPDQYVGKLVLLVSQIPNTHWPSLAVAMVTLAVMLLWPRLKTPVPAHLLAVTAGSLAALALNHWGLPVATIATRFSYTLANGELAQGIPAVMPHWVWPWLQPGAEGAPLAFTWATFNDLLSSAFAIAMLGAIESLLCAVVLDGMTGKRHSANSELLAQGIGNIVTPFFGGITATAAIARSAANVQAGAQSPVAAMVHSLVVLVGFMLLAPLLGYLPMPSLAALLMVVAWNMSEAPKALHLWRHAQTSDRLVLACCCLLTVVFDMVIAITAGIVLAALLFMKDMARMTRVLDISEDKSLVPHALPASWKIYKITGPLFFAAADKVFSQLAAYCAPNTGMILYWDNVHLLDSGGLAALHKLIARCQATQTQLLITDLQYQPLRALNEANTQPIPGVFELYPTLVSACAAILQEGEDNTG